MVLYQGVVAQGDNGKYLSRTGHWVGQEKADLFDRDRLARAISSMIAPGPFYGALKLLPAERNDNEAPIVKTECSLGELRFPSPLPAGSRVVYDNGSMVTSLLRAVEPPALSYPPSKTSF